MIRFLAPWAAAGLVLLAGPLLVHMLLRRHARHVRFPATRFLITTHAAAVRLRRPSDILLLTLRLAIVGAAIAATAQPIVVTPRRVAQWDARVIRAVVVDTSTSAAQHSETGRLADRELSAAFRAQRFDGTDLPDALTRATAWFDTAPPGRREVVLVSDFQRGSLAREDLGVLPSGAGLRTVRVGAPPQSRDVRLAAVVGFRDASWQPSVRLDATGTSVTWTKSAGTPLQSWLSTSQAASEREAAARAVYAAVSAGVATADESRRVHIRFPGAPADVSKRGPVRTAWMVDAALALRRSELLRQTNATVRTEEGPGRLIVETDVAPSSFAAPAVARAVVLAVRPAAIADRETEVVALSDAELASWRRDAAPVKTAPDSSFSGTAPDSDVRWFWALALALLGAESWLRGRQGASATAQVRDAA